MVDTAHEMKFSAVILAGGLSRRMGRDKALLEIEGQPLAERQVALAKTMGAEEIFISARPQAGGAFKVPMLSDLKPGLGPLSGIERALAEATHSLVLVLAVDLPYLSADLLQNLRKQCSPDVGAVPLNGRQIEPLAAFYPKAAHALAASRLESGEFRVRDFAEACSQRGLVRLLPFPAGRRDFVNWNCPEDLNPPALT
jgi:molybdopterin-guanine dinucleotide biosynthesis protein A